LICDEGQYSDEQNCNPCARCFGHYESSIALPREFQPGHIIGQLTPGKLSNR
jgi:hypothetical protein